MAKLYTIADSFKQLDVRLEIRINPRLHDREIKLSNGWCIKIGRGFDIYQRPDDWLHIGSNIRGVRVRERPGSTARLEARCGRRLIIFFERRIRIIRNLSDLHDL
jgi:hypothetical protein